MNISRTVKQPSEWNFGRAKSVNSLTACCEEWFEQLWDLCALLLPSSSLRYIKLTQCQNYSFNLFWLKKEIFSGSGELKVCKWDESRNHTAVAVRRFFAAFSLIMPCFCKTFYIEMVLILFLSQAIFLMCDLCLLEKVLSQFCQNHIKSLLHWFLLKCLNTPSLRTLQNSENSRGPRHGANSAGKTGQNSALPPIQRDQTRAGNNSEK